MGRPPLVPAIGFMVLGLFAASVRAQEPVVAPTVVPPVVRFTGTLSPLEGQVVATFALYAEASGGEPLWSETQLVSVQPGGRYTVLLGATSSEGAPSEVFAAGAARWVGVRVDGEEERPRILLASVPYALKAEDAETIGGKRLSDFLFAGATTGVGPDGLTYVNPDMLTAALASAFVPAANAGTANYIGLFTNTTDLGNSVMYQAGSSIGLNTLAPAAAFHVMAPAAPAAYFDVYNNLLGALPVVYRAARGTPSSPAPVQTGDILGGLAVRGYGTSTFSAGRGQVMFRAAENWTDEANGTYLQFTTTPLGSGDWVERVRVDPAGNVGIGTTAPAEKLSVAGTIESTSGGFKFPDGTTQATASTGGTTYTAGPGLSLVGAQFSALFAGAGSADSVSRSDHDHPQYFYAAGAGLSLVSNTFSVVFGGTGAASAAARSDHLHDSRYPLLSGSYNDPSWLTGLAAAKVTGSLPVSQVSGAATLGANTFTATQTLSAGNLALPATSAAGSGVVTLGGTSFAHAYPASAQNTFVGPNAGGAFTATGSQNTGIGPNALRYLTTAVDNTAVGANSLGATTTGGGNTAVGKDSLQTNTTGTGNSAFGVYALRSNAGTSSNSAFGYSALRWATATANSAFGSLALSATTTGEQNSAFGTGALQNNVLGHRNSAFGKDALFNNTATGNSSFGASSLASNTGGSMNCAFGDSALHQNNASVNSAFGYASLTMNTTGSGNSTLGANTLWHNTAGSSNTAVGTSALYTNVDASQGTAIGYQSLYYATAAGNTGVGYRAGFSVTSGASNTFLGASADAASGGLQYAAAIGAAARVAASNALVLGGTGAAAVNVGINTEAPDTRLQVVGDIKVGTSGTNGCLKNFSGGTIAGTCSSDVRLKANIRPFGPVLERLVGLRPVHYTWKVDDFPSYHFGPGTQSGLVAQEVERVFPELVATDEHGYKMVNYTELPYLTLAAVRELKAEGDRLHEENDRLRAQVTSVGAANQLLQAELAALHERLARLERASGSRR